MTDYNVNDYNVNLWLPVSSSVSMVANIYVLIKLSQQITPETMEASAAKMSRATIIGVCILLSLMLAVIIFFLTTLGMKITGLAYIVPAACIAIVSIFIAIGTFWAMKKPKTP